ncbi:MAG: hypothetical protein AAF629_35375, partial [Chloroflexota bacterium]
NQSVYIPIGTKHRITNTGTDKLVFIEVQCGDYLYVSLYHWLQINTETSWLPYWNERR